MRGGHAILRRPLRSPCIPSRPLRRRPAPRLIPAPKSGRDAGDAAGLKWCESEHLLSSLYGFTHQPCSQLQSNADVSGLCDILRRFTASLTADHPLAGPKVKMQQAKAGVQCHDEVPAPLSWANVQALQHAMELVGSDECMTWFPQYGCALLALRPAGETVHIQMAANDDTLLLVGLDCWNFAVHSTAVQGEIQGEMQGEIQHCATPGDGTVVPCGTLPAEARPSFQASLEELLRSATERQGVPQSAAGGQQGHQQTPAFIRALVLQALEAARAGSGAEDHVSPAEVPLQQPNGGFTDVGRHTGGLARDTAWPLVREAVKAVLDHVGACRSPTPDLHQLALAHLHLWLLQRQLPLITPKSATSTALNAAMRMLQAAASQAADLAAKGHNMAHFEQACWAAREHMDATAAARAQQAAERFRLPPLDAAASPCGPGSYRCPQGQLPEETTVRQEGEGLEAARKRATLNLNSLPMLSWQTFAALLELLRSPELQRPGSDAAVQQALCTVEADLFRRAAGGFAAEAALTELEVDALVDVVDEYQKVLCAWKNSPAAASRMRVELRSRALLVTWAAFCMVHAATSHTHPVLQQYGAGLHWEGLRHLVLSDRPALDTLLAVTAYLQSHTKPGRAVFTLSDSGAATFDMATRFAAADAQLMKIWEQEEAAAAQRKAKHWEEVRAKQAVVANLRKQLQLDEAAENEARQKLEAAQGARHWPGGQDRRNQCQNELDQAKFVQRATQSALSRALVPPGAVIQPLPKSKDAALSWLFFLYMPPMFRQLSRLTFLAQQHLLPQQPGAQAHVKEKTGVVAPKTLLLAHYNVHSDLKAGNEGRVQLISDFEAPTQRQVRLDTVDDYRHDNNGVWHPDSLLQRMGWQGSGSSADAPLDTDRWFNPFYPMPNDLLVEDFTEQLPSAAAEHLQWAMLQYGSGAVTAPDRGNIALAQQDKRPDWLSKPGYLAFGALRAYPLIQLRKLCVALQERSLPLGHAAVQVLVQQTLYHGGTLTASQPPTLLWRTDWDAAGDVLSTLCDELSQLATELDQTPREHASVLLLGEVAGYLSAWHPPLYKVAQRFAAMAARWADELEGSALEAAPPAKRDLRAKQCLLRMTALLCYASVQSLSREDVQSMLGLMVLIRHGRAYGEDTPDQKELARLQVLCHWTMTRRAGEVVQTAVLQPHALTHALRLVLQRAPVRLAWQQVRSSKDRSQMMASFEAVGDDGHLYSINCLDGTVLENGCPPGRLPAEILGHRLYQRSFGEWAFEVTVTAGGVRSSISRVRGCFYEFFMGEAGDLVVMEVDERGRRLWLAD